MLRYNQFFTEAQLARLHHAHVLTGLSCSEILRRLLDYGLQQATFDALFPSVSGCLLTSSCALRSGG